MAGPAKELQTTAEESKSGGSRFDFRVTARDVGGNVATDTYGQLSVTRDGDQAVLDRDGRELQTLEVRSIWIQQPQFACA